MGMATFCVLLAAGVVAESSTSSSDFPNKYDEIYYRLPLEQRMKFMSGGGFQNYVGVLDWRREGNKDQGSIAKLPYLYNNDSDAAAAAAHSFLPELQDISIPPIHMMDNGNGWRNQPDGDHRSVTFPPGAALGLTFDKKLVESTGRIIGKMFKFRGANLILGPALTLHRTPYGSRNWEYIGGEDQIVAGTLGVQYAKGAHSQNVMTMAKHWINNHQETDRKHMTVQLNNASTEFEMYMKPFEMYLQNGGTSVMCGYNKIQILENDNTDGASGEGKGQKDFYQTNPAFWECDSSVTLNYAKRKYKNFFVGSDWSAVSHSPIDANFLPYHGLDMELPGNLGDNGPKFTQTMLTTFLYHKESITGRSMVQESAVRILAAMDGVGALNATNWPENWENRQQMSDNPADIYVDWNEKRGGSNGYSKLFPADLLDEAKRAAREVALEGMVMLKNTGDLLPLKGDAEKKTFFKKDNKKGDSVADSESATTTGGTLNIGTFGCAPSSIKSENGFYNWNGFFINGAGSGAVHWEEKELRTLHDTLQEVPSVESVFSVDRNQLGLLVEKYDSKHGKNKKNQKCDVALVCYSVYTGEAYIMPNKGDRDTLKLHTMNGTSDYNAGYAGMPIEVSDHGCKKTVALVSTPGAFSNVLDTAEIGMGDFDSILMNVYPGEEYAGAYTDVLFSRNGAFPGGRLTFTLPQKESDVSDVFKPHSGTVEYKEGDAMGYRYFQRESILPAYSFGYGLQYAALKLDNPGDVEVTFAAAGSSKKSTISNVCVENTDQFHAGSEVVLFWFQRADRDYKELLHFEKFKHLAPRERMCMNDIEFEPVMIWDGSVGDLRPYGTAADGTEKLKIFVSVQGLSAEQYGSTSGSDAFVKNAGAGNSYAKFLVDNHLAGDVTEVRYRSAEQGNDAEHHELFYA